MMFAPSCPRCLCQGWTSSLSSARFGSRALRSRRATVALPPAGARALVAGDTLTELAAKLLADEVNARKFPESSRTVIVIAYTGEEGHEVVRMAVALELYGTYIVVTTACALLAKWCGAILPVLASVETCLVPRGCTMVVLTSSQVELQLDMRGAPAAVRQNTAIVATRRASSAYLLQGGELTGCEAEKLKSPYLMPSIATAGVALLSAFKGNTVRHRLPLACKLASASVNVPVR